MCNISGYSGGAPPDPLKLKLLHVLGRMRGVDSAGIVINNRVTREVSTGYTNAYKTYNNADDSEMGDAVHFIQTGSVDYKFPKKDWETFNVLQHNRKKSSGAKTVKEAHPYEIVYEDKEGNPQSFFLVHNGTISNISRLCEFFNEKFSDYVTDSEALAHLILKYGFDPLKYYEGGAALAFYYTSEPDTLYLFKGASEIKKWKDNEYITYTEEERPLRYIYLDKGMYFSSLDSQLRALLPTTKEFQDANIWTIKENKIGIFKNGKLSKWVDIQREELPKLSEETIIKNNNLNIGIIDGFDGIQYLYGKYYYKGELATGEFEVGLTGTIKGINARTYYFYRGYWLKSKVDYDRMIDSKIQVHIYSTDIHGDGIYINHNNSYYHQRSFCSNKLFKPRFAHYYIKIDTRGEVSHVYTKEIMWKEGLLTVDQARIEMFNLKYSVNLSSKIECEEYYEELFGKKLSWDHVEKYPKEIEVHSKYKTEKSSTYWTPESGNKVIGGYNNYENLPASNLSIASRSTEVGLDARLANFNKYNGTDFKERKDANTWHYENYGIEFDTDWGLDEAYLKLNSENNSATVSQKQATIIKNLFDSTEEDDDYDEYKELFYAQEGNNTEIPPVGSNDYEDIKKQLVEEYDNLIEEITNFYYEYGYLDLKDPEKDKVEAAERAKDYMIRASSSKKAKRYK